VQQHRGQGQGPVGRCAEGEHAHVLDAGVGQHPLVVPLPDQQRRGEQQRGDGQDRQQGPGEPSAERLADDRLDAEENTDEPSFLVATRPAGRSTARCCDKFAASMPTSGSISPTACSRSDSSSSTRIRAG
jgi:hypothetical protein